MAKSTLNSFAQSFWNCAWICQIILLSKASSNVVFQPSYIIASGPSVSSLLLGDTSGITLTLTPIVPSNSTGQLPPPSCIEQPSQWVLKQESVSKTSLQVQLSLNRSFYLCGSNETGDDCCLEPLCVLEVLRVSACRGGTPQATLLIQVKIYALLLPSGPGSENKTVIPNQVFQPLGPCPCDFTVGACDIRCCCDKDCSDKTKKLFEGHCFQGPFGGEVSPTPDYQCSAQSAENAPDWFPFLCVTSSPDNNPYLGLFYQGQSITPKPGPSFQAPVPSTPPPSTPYRQGDAIFTTNNRFFTVPQNSLIGQCVENAPLAFLENFNAECSRRLLSCPDQPPLQTNPADLKVKVKDGRGGVVTVEVTDETVVDLTGFVSSPDIKDTSPPPVDLTTRYSAVFLNGDVMAQTNSGNPGYQVGRPVIGGILDTFGNDTGVMQRTPIHLWRPVSAGFCDSAELRPVVFGENSTAGCLLAVNLHNLSQCSLLRETVGFLQANLVTATHVARTGKPDFRNLADWVNITFLTPNSAQAVDASGSCSGVPANLHIHVSSLVSGLVEGVPQREIQAIEVSYTESTWRLGCGGGDPTPCLNPAVTQNFPLTSSITFTSILISTGPPQTRFQINFTEYDCDRNDVCWPQLAFPLTRYYTGEPYSQALAKGFILVFFFIASCILGTPWKQIRQAWNSASI
ncbi:tectonic-2 isoform X2 [Hypomesus transpacificus]|uniref:tectonic-2 isoform X2 n=1 Tax=Hypomesus transpacificus TaxID=137520 RepID=UPI001F07B190|nr:tectonic-2 isoform X2 [Hypomesus transpacificus]